MADRPPAADALRAVTDVVAATGFSGGVRIDRGDEVALAAGYGLADRAHGIANTADTRFAMASGSKTFTALAVMSLVADGTITLDTTARSLLGADLPLIDDAVTVEHLLAHRSGIGDYLDEEAAGPITDYAMPVAVHLLDHTEAFLPAVDGYPQVSPPGERFAYNNGGFVVLAVLAERASGVPFAELVSARVWEPAGLTSTSFLRSDELPGDAAIGYLDATGPRTNIFHLPIFGGGDGGAYTTLADVHRLWPAFMSGAIVPADLAAEMVRPRSTTDSGRWRYGLGFWLDGAGPGVALEGYDAGVSFRAHHHPATGVTWTVVSNSSEGAWPVAEAVAAAMDDQTDSTS